MELHYQSCYFNYGEFFEDLGFLFDARSYYQCRNSFICPHKCAADSYDCYNPHADYNGVPCVYDGQFGNETHPGPTRWQDALDPDSMTYEELLELGETVGSESRGLSSELISLLPVSKYKRRFFLGRKSRTERCIICQMEYTRGERRVTLPCNHVYHATCGESWLSVSKACPICYVHVFADLDVEL